jgi:hypothetical protein
MSLEDYKKITEFLDPALYLWNIFMRIFMLPKFVERMKKQVVINKNGKVVVGLSNDRYPLTFEIEISNNSFVNSVKLERIILQGCLIIDKCSLTEKIDALATDTSFSIDSHIIEPSRKREEPVKLSFSIFPHPLAFKHNIKWVLEGQIHFSSAGALIVKDVSIDCGKIDENMFKKAKEGMKKTLKEYLDSLNSDT